jgi:hypothetical protein
MSGPMEDMTMFPDLFTVHQLAADRQREYLESARVSRLKRSHRQRQRASWFPGRLSFRRAGMTESPA